MDYPFKLQTFQNTKINIYIATVNVIYKIIDEANKRE